MIVEKMPEESPDTYQPPPGVCVKKPLIAAKTVNLIGRARRFQPKAGSDKYPDVKVCAHASVADVQSATIYPSSTCAISNQNGDFTLKGVPVGRLIYISWTNGGTAATDLLPLMQPLYLQQGIHPQIFPWLQAVLVDKTEATVVAGLLNLSLDLSKQGLLVTDISTGRINPVAGVTVSIFPSLPMGGSGPVYLPASIPGSPGMGATTASGTAVFALPAGQYSLGYSKQGASNCGAYPTTPATDQLCRPNTTCGTNDCSLADVLVGWQTSVVGTCP